MTKICIIVRIYPFLYFCLKKSLFNASKIEMFCKDEIYIYPECDTRYNYLIAQLYLNLKISNRQNFINEHSEIFLLILRYRE